MSTRIGPKLPRNTQPAAGVGRLVSVVEAVLFAPESSANVLSSDGVLAGLRSELVPQEHLVQNRVGSASSKFDAFHLE